MRFLLAAIILLFSIMGFESIKAQVFIPFAFWKPAGSTLTISDSVTYNYGSVLVSTPTDKTFTLVNTGSNQITAMSGAAFSGANFTFKGGTYPGTGGTCSTTLASLASCTIVVTANRATAATVNDTVTVNYFNSLRTTTATRAITATFVSAATNLAWINTPSFIKVSTCVAVTVQSQDGAGNPVNVGGATTVNLVINNATATTFYTNSGCTTSTTSRTIGIGTNSVSFYVQSTTANQSGIFVATATGLISGSQNVNITAAPTKLFFNPPPRIKTSTCTAMPVNSVDASNYNSTVGGNVTVNLTTSGANIYYSDAGCSASITSTTILSGTYTTTIYTSNATVQTVTLTATDNAAVLTPSSKSVTFATSLTWWNTSWARRIRIDINNSDQSVGFTDQPVLVALDSTRVTYSDIQANGADVRFVASDDTTQLAHEFDQWNSGGTSKIWVEIPTITASSTADYFYMYFKNSSAIDGQNKNSVWSNYWSVWHLGEDPTATAPQYLDSTSAARNGTATNSPTRVTGYVGSAVDLSSATDAVDINSNLSTALGVSSTLSFWLRTTQTGNNTMWQAPGITGIEQAGGGNDIFYGWIDGSGYIGVTAGNGANAKSAFIVNNNAWRHVTITRNSTSGAVVFYVNGVQSNTATSETGSKTTYFDLLGEIGDTGGSPVNYNGTLDEVRIYNSVRTADQVEADFKYMMDTHLIFGSTEQYP